MEGHRIAAHGRIHQVHVQDRKKVLGLGGRGDAGDTGHHRQRDSKGSHHQQLRCGDAARPEQVQGAVRQHQGHSRTD